MRSRLVLALHQGRKVKTMLKRRTVGAALLTLAISAAAFFGTLWSVPSLADRFMVYEDDKAYLPPLVQIPILAVVGASVLGALWGLVRLILALTTWPNCRKRQATETGLEADGVWPPTPKPPRFR